MQLDGIATRTSNSPPRLNPSRDGKHSAPAAGSSQSLFIHSKKAGEKMLTEVSSPKTPDISAIEQVVMMGDLSKLNPEQRVIYYRKVCESAGLNPFTNPFAYISLNGKLTLYAKKDCTEQLRKIHGVSIEDLDDKMIDDLYIVKAKAKDKYGRTDESTGAVVIGNLKGEAKANAIMKCETKAKRRVTLSICGMGWTDESEIDAIPNAKPVDIDLSTGEIKGSVEIPVNDKPKIDLVKLTVEQMEALQDILDNCEEKYQKWVYEYVKKTFGSFADVPADMFERMKMAAEKNRSQNQAKIKSEEENALLVEAVSQ
jgi:hypothetical protein